MTRGLLLNPEQSDLFEIYRPLFFGAPNTMLDGATLRTVTDILAKHPDLQKTHFPEFEIRSVRRIYDTPEAFAKYLSGQIRSAGHTRADLFQIEANIGFWMKLLGYETPEPPEGLSKDEIKKFKDEAKAHFMRWLDRVVSPANRQLLADPKQDYRGKVISLYKTLERVRDWMLKEQRDAGRVSQAMADLVHTSGYGNAATQELLKSKNGLEKLEGLKKILDERDAIAIELGFAGHYVELLKKLGVDHPTGSAKYEDYTTLVFNFEREILQGSFKTEPTEVARTRSLSIQEAPFRSCLGGSDCATRNYFSKALDPNFHYFTRTYADNHSSGHVTVVLGSARMAESQKEVKIAFIDKIQNVPNQELPVFLEAIRLSLAKKGYLLGLPTHVGDHDGLSNMDTTRHFVAREVLPRFKQRLLGFTPHPHQYNFENKYSRAYAQLEIVLVTKLKLDAATEIVPGMVYEPQLADTSLNAEALTTELLALAKSPLEADKLKFIESGMILNDLAKRIPAFDPKFYPKTLAAFIADRSNTTQVRKRSLYKLLLINPRETPNLHTFDAQEITQIKGEMSKWITSRDSAKRSVATLFERWLKAQQLQSLASSRFEADQLEFIAQGEIFDELVKQLMVQDDFSTLSATLSALISDKSNTLEVRKRALYLLLVFLADESAQIFEAQMPKFDVNQAEIIKNELIQWGSSIDAKKRLVKAVFANWLKAQQLQAQASSILEADQLEFIKNGASLRDIAHQFKSIAPNFYSKKLRDLIREKSNSFEVRKSALYQQLVNAPNAMLSILEASLSEFNSAELELIKDEIDQWNTSTDGRAQMVARNFSSPAVEQIFNVANRSIASTLRLQSLFKLLVVNVDEFATVERLEALLPLFSIEEINEIKSELSGWQKSSDMQQRGVKSILDKPFAIAALAIVDYKLAITPRLKLETLLSPIEINQVFISAISRGRADLIQVLLRSPSFNVNTRDRFGFTPLMRAVELQQNEIIQLLLKRPDIDVNAKKPDGVTALSIAERQRDNAVINLLRQRDRELRD